jgi:hypothetical protein
MTRNLEGTDKGEVKMAMQIATHLELSQPIQIRPHTKIMIAVLASDDIPEEREAWFRFASEQFQAAYGEDEPEYTLDMIREPNPEYRP